MNKDKIMIDDVETLLYWLRTELEDKSESIQCEDGVGKFVSMGTINGRISRLKRALHNETLQIVLTKQALGDLYEETK